jgi:3-phenylpropionate/trans-cinnamate dioxygenase ferredoxin component
MTWVRVAGNNDLSPGTFRQVKAGGQLICLARVADGRLFALSDECTHEQALLSEGELEGNEIECPLHYSRFELETGRATGLPATEAACTFEVRIVDGAVEIALP